jgi:hypothetical protein
VGCTHALLFTFMKHPVLLTLGCFVLVFACWLGWAIYRDRQLSDGFDKVKTGASESEVSVNLVSPNDLNGAETFFDRYRRTFQLGALANTFTHHRLRLFCPHTTL